MTGFGITLSRILSDKSHDRIQYDKVNHTDDSLTARTCQRLMSCKSTESRQCSG